jgi:hypothetical protein
MARSRLSEKYLLNVEGIVNINENDNVVIEIPDVGNKNISDLLTKVNGELVKLSVSKIKELG